MRFCEPSHVSLRPALAIFAGICIRTISCIFSGIFPRLPRERCDGAIQGCEDRGVLIGGVEAGADGNYISREPREDIDGALRADDV